MFCIRSTTKRQYVDTFHGREQAVDAFDRTRPNHLQDCNPASRADIESTSQKTLKCQRMISQQSHVEFKEHEFQRSEFGEISDKLNSKWKMNASIVNVR